MNFREALREKQRVVVKVGTSSLTHAETGKLNLTRLEILVRELSDLRNQGKDVVLVSSGAIGVGSAALGWAENLPNLESLRPARLWVRPADDDLSEAVYGI